MPPPTTTAGGTVQLSPTTAVPGAHQDGADLYGIVVALLVIGVAIAVVRLAFRRR